MKKVMYINLVTVSESSEEIDSLPAITIIENKGKKYITGGLLELAAAIIEMAEYLGEDRSELMPFAVEKKDESELTVPSTIPRQRRRRRTDVNDR